MIMATAMSAVPTTSTELKGLPVMTVRVIGKVDTMRRHEGSYYTQVLTPAADEYSRPQVLEIRSKQKLGDKEDKIDIQCTLGGYRRKPYKFTDKDTGEIRNVVPVDHSLDAGE